MSRKGRFIILIFVFAAWIAVNFALSGPQRGATNILRGLLRMFI